MAQFSSALATVLQHEGGYVHNPADPGGETKYGISRRAHPGIDIKNLTVEQAGALYRTDYWNPIQGDNIRNEDVAANLFDFAVNVGVQRAVKTIQRLVGVSQDGVLGPITLRAIEATDSLNLNLRLSLARIEYYNELARRRSELRPFLIAWVRRSLAFV